MGRRVHRYAAGSGTYWLAVIGTAVTLATLYGLTAIDAAIARRKAKVSQRLEVPVGDVSKPEDLLKFMRRINPAIEELQFQRRGEGEATLVISCPEGDVTMVSEMLVSHGR